MLFVGIYVLFYFLFSILPSLFREQMKKHNESKLEDERRKLEDDLYKQEFKRIHGYGTEDLSLRRRFPELSEEEFKIMLKKLRGNKRLV